MAALAEGNQYGLSSNLADYAGKTVVYVKLTDSALRALDVYSKNKKSCSSKSSIQFKGENGLISIPDVSSNGKRTYHFNLSSIQGDPNGSFDCIQQQSRRSSQLDLLGSMNHRMTIQAGEDVYQATKEKMTLAEEESKKVCAKEIKPSGPNIGRRVKKVIKHSSLKLPPTNTNSVLGRSSDGVRIGHSSRLENSGSSYHGGAFKSGINTSQRPPHSQSNSLNHHQQQHHHHNHHNQQQQHHSGAASSQYNRNASQSQQHSQSQSSISPSHPPPPPPPPSSAIPKTRETIHKPPVSNSGIINRPYRDRVIHLLAVRPYKKPELIARLQRDGIREKDKNCLGSILQQVASLNARDNTFMLTKSLYNEVQLDWPFYTEVDKQLLRRRLPREPSGTPSPPTSGVSPLSSLGSQQNSPVLASHQQQQQQQHHQSQKRPHQSTTDDAKPPPVSNKKPRLSDKSNQNAIIQDADSTQSRKENQRGGVSPPEMASSTSDTPDYVNQYTVITSNEQRQKYKTVFNSQYDEYRKLHANVDKVSKRFSELEQSLRKTQEGTTDHENIKNKILTEYKNIKADPKFVEQKKRFEYLHNKLAHVKRKILEYDQLHTS
ncbi:RNA polymerase II elongation factor ELL2-like [Tubulanus polymorphus]|uniref:RNA polymerase II elongation factor ELL2-like n=1 Tax=Tubulanus polymorphus TaxID=672921 RepID=UPI003DA2B086